MKSTIITAAALAFGLVAAPAMAGQDAGQAETAQQEQARIPFADTGGIRDWRMTDDDTLYVQDRLRRWYRAELMRPVVGMRPQIAIGFETRGTDTFDRFSNIVIRGERYPVNSLVRIEGEPPAHGAHAQEGEKRA